MANYIILFPPKEYLRWYVDEFGFLEVELMHFKEN